MASSSTEDTWEEIERLAISENKYEREGALKRARFCVEQRLRESGYTTSDGGVAAQLRRFATDHGMDEREFSVIIEGLRYRNETEHEGKEVGRLGVLSTVWALRAFCDPKPIDDQREKGITLGRLVTQLKEEFPTETSDFLVFLLRELAHHEKQGLERACEQGHVTREELRFLFTRPRHTWKDTVLILAGTEGHPKSLEGLGESWLQGVIANPVDGPEARSLRNLLTAMAGTPEKRLERKRRHKARRDELEQKWRHMQEARKKEMGCLSTLLVAAVIVVVATLAIIWLGNTFLKE